MRTTTRSALLSGGVKVSPRPEKTSMIEGAEMPRPWLRNRVQPPRPKVLLSRPSTALHMAASLSSTMLNIITKFFAPKVPTTDIAGVALTHDEGAHLMHTCNALKHALNLQLDVISKMPYTSNEHIVSKIRQIQIRHTDIHIHLSLAVSKTKYSTTLWAREFSDAHAALERKIVSLNRRSRGLGWIKVAQQCWPGIAATYGWLLPLVLRLQGELRRALKQKELWSADTAPQAVEESDEKEQQALAALYTTYPRVHFGREATVREYHIGSTIGEQSARKPSAAALSDDRKRTAGRFKGKKTKFEVWLSDSDL